MTETYKKIIESVESGELMEMSLSDDISERLVGQGIISALNLSVAFQVYVAQVLEDECPDR